MWVAMVSFLSFYLRVKCCQFEPPNPNENAKTLTFSGSFVQNTAFFLLVTAFLTEAFLGADVLAVENTVTVPYLNSFGGAEFSGYVGMGKTGPQAALDVLGSPGGPSAYNKGVLQVATGTTVGLDIGNYAPAPYASWIQSQDSRSGVATSIRWY